MNCFVRASKYLYRKKRKAILLLLLFLVINVMVSGTLAIRASSLRLAEELRKNSEGKIMLESLDRQSGFEEQDLQEIMAAENINWINRISETNCLSSQMFPVAGNAESEDLFDVHGYDELEKDSPFAEHIYRVVEGYFPQSRDEIIINKYLAEKNGIQVGEKILLQSIEQQAVEAVVTGFFLAGDEERQTENVATVNRIENQLYATTDFVNTLYGEKKFINAVVYVNDPELLGNTSGILAEMYEGRAVISSMDNTFQRLSLTIGQTERITFLILLMTILVGGCGCRAAACHVDAGQKKGDCRAGQPWCVKREYISANAIGGTIPVWACIYRGAGDYSIAFACRGRQNGASAGKQLHAAAFHWRHDSQPLCRTGRGDDIDGDFCFPIHEKAGQRSPVRNGGVV